MKARWFAAGAVVGVLATVVVHAQTKQDLQMQQDLRMLQEQIQQLKATVATLADASKATRDKLDEQAKQLQKNHADELDTLRPVKEQVNGLATKMDQYSGEVRRFSADLPSLGKGLTQQQQALDKILAVISSPVPTPPAFSAGGAPPPQGTPLPPVPSALFNQAKGNYTAGQYALAIQGFEAFLQIPESAAYADEAQYWLGVSNNSWAKYPAAQAAFQKLIDNYKTSPRVPDAYFSLGESLRAQGKKTEAIAAYTQAYKLAPDSDAGMQAKQALQALGVK